jgi:hypothetical protein
VIRWRRGAAWAVGLLASASLARADAPSDQYFTFDMDALYIVDRWTNLKWERTPAATTFVWADAFAHCSALSLSDTRSGWRVPSYKELLTLVDENPHVQYENLNVVSKWIDYDAFPVTSVSASYWTSSHPLEDPSKAYSVDFGLGTGSSEFVMHLLNVRCVHD